MDEEELDKKFYERMDKKAEFIKNKFISETQNLINEIFVLVGKYPAGQSSLALNVCQKVFLDTMKKSAKEKGWSEEGEKIFADFLLKNSSSLCVVKKVDDKKDN